MVSKYFHISVATYTARGNMLTQCLQKQVVDRCANSGVWWTLSDSLLCSLIAIHITYDRQPFGKRYTRVAKHVPNYRIIIIEQAL